MNSSEIRMTSMPTWLCYVLWQGPAPQASGQRKGGCRIDPELGIAHTRCGVSTRTRVIRVWYDRCWMDRPWRQDSTGKIGIWKEDSGN